MEIPEYNSLYNAGLKLREEGSKFRDAGNHGSAMINYAKAIEIFEDLDPIEFHKDKFNKSLILGSLYDRTGNKKKAFEMFSRAVGLNPDSELASLCLYLNYVELDQSEKAIDELKRFLSDHPADLFKDTLEELLGELRDGRLPYYRDEILALARRNNVSFDISI